ncbi:MAG: CotH kinase family protein, partial [Bacteroidaceae bacterium]|nr:CotH kinase family protein [Bacteroidaceae bacterium]
DDDDDDEINDSIYNSVDVFKEPCLFVSLTNGGIDAYPLNTLANEQYNNNDTLYVPLTSGNTIKYNASEYKSISNEVPQLPYFTSYKFNNKYNANLNTDVVADCSGENIEVSLNAIGKSLTASFQLSEERAVAYIGNRLQTSKETRNRFAEAVKYTITYPGYNIILDIKTQDSLYKTIKIPFGRIYTVTPKWLTDNNNIPRIDIDMIYSASSINKETYLDAKFTISGFGVYDDFADSVQIKGRGNSTWSYAKKPYRLKFASKVKPFGLTKGKSWVLLANAQWGALMANAIAMKVGQLANVPYTNHIIPVDLYINGEYKGNYMFTEHLGLSGNSVDEDEDLAYMLELDDYYDEDFKFRSDKYNLPVNIKDPDLFDYIEIERDAKFNAIKADFQRFENALYNNDQLGKYLDLDVAARFLLVNDLVLNMELCHPKSTYLWKGDLYSSESKIKFGPLWDFDCGFGYQNTGSYFTVDYKTKLLSMAVNGRNFFQALMNNEEFKKYYYKVWKEFDEKGYINEIKEFISDYYSFVEQSFMNNADIWNGDGYDYGSKIITMQNWMQKRHDYIVNNLKECDITDIIHTMIGDIDCNDQLTIHDVALLADYLIGTTDSCLNIKKADVDNNGKIEHGDLVRNAILLANGDPVTPMYYYNTPVSNTELMAMKGTSVSDNTFVIPVYLQNNKEGIKAIQADIVVPSDIVIENILTDNKAKGDTVVYVQMTNELYRVVAYNKNGTPFADDKPIFNIEFFDPYYSSSEQSVARIKDILVVDSANLEKRINDTQIELTGKENYYKVTYIVDGETYATDSIAYGAEITLIDSPEKEGYTFCGWSDVPETMPAEDIIITGAFTVNYYKVTYIVDGETYATDSIAYGAEITLIDSPEKEGYTFSGWSGVPETMPAEDIIITGALVNTNISIISTDAIIKVNGNIITLIDAVGNSVTIYSSAGTLVEKIDSYSGEEITLDNGVYIVRIENKIVKIKI